MDSASSIEQGSFTPAATHDVMSFDLWENVCATMEFLMSRDALRFCAPDQTEPLRLHDFYRSKPFVRDTFTQAPWKIAILEVLRFVQHYHMKSSVFSWYGRLVLGFGEDQHDMYDEDPDTPRCTCGAHKETPDGTTGCKKRECEWLVHLERQRFLAFVRCDDNQYIQKERGKGHAKPGNTSSSSLGRLQKSCAVQNGEKKNQNILDAYNDFLTRDLPLLLYRVLTGDFHTSSTHAARKVHVGFGECGLVTSTSKRNTAHTVNDFLIMHCKKNAAQVKAVIKKAQTENLNEHETRMEALCNPKVVKMETEMTLGASATEASSSSLFPTVSPATLAEEVACREVLSTDELDVQALVFALHRIMVQVKGSTAGSIPVSDWKDVILQSHLFLLDDAIKCAESRRKIKWTSTLDRRVNPCTCATRCTRDVDEVEACQCCKEVHEMSSGTALERHRGCIGLLDLLAKRQTLTCASCGDIEHPKQKSSKLPVESTLWKGARKVAGGCNDKTSNRRSRSTLHAQTFCQANGNQLWRNATMEACLPLEYMDETSRSPALTFLIKRERLSYNHTRLRPPGMVKTTHAGQNNICMEEGRRKRAFTNVDGDGDNEEEDNEDDESGEDEEDDHPEKDDHPVRKTHKWTMDSWGACANPYDRLCINTHSSQITADSRGSLYKAVSLDSCGTCARNRRAKEGTRRQKGRKKDLCDWNGLPRPKATCVQDIMTGGNSKWWWTHILQKESKEDRLAFIVKNMCAGCIAFLRCRHRQTSILIMHYLFS